MRYLTIFLMLASSSASAQQFDRQGSSDTFGGTTYGRTDDGTTWESQRFGGTTYYRDSDGNYRESYTSGGHTETMDLR